MIFLGFLEYLSAHKIILKSKIIRKILNNIQKRLPILTEINKILHIDFFAQIFFI
jgi:hypothetical protein